ncbi:MAG: hypothetical protein ABGW74_04025 [Campylobacterales bacterium]
MCSSRNIELIYNMSKALPKELRGDYVRIEEMFIKILRELFSNCEDMEIVMSIEAKEDFIKDNVTFTITNIPFKDKGFFLLLEESIKDDLSILNGSIDYSEIGVLRVNIPLQIGELGFRRHYRLPSKSLLQKNILLIIHSQNVTLSVTRMFKYFPYNVDISFKRFREDKYSLIDYDLVVIEDSLIGDRFLDLISVAQAEKSIKLVIFRNKDSSIKVDNTSAYLDKPVTQESIFELIVSLFTQEGIANNCISDGLVVCVKDEFDRVLDSKRATYQKILDIEKGLKRARELDNSYSDVLKEFLDTFDKSDLYFREISNSKLYDEIERFYKDLKIGAKFIGAESMYRFVETLELVFEYKKFEYLPIYPGRYHLELQKLIKEIRGYLLI